MRPGGTTLIERVLRTGWLRVVMAGVLACGWLLASAGVAHAGGFVRLSELVERHGLRVEVDLISGRHVLSGSGTRVVLAPGMRQVLVGDGFVALEDSVTTASGDLLVPVAGAQKIASALGAPARSEAEPAPVRSPAPALSAGAASLERPRVERVPVRRVQRGTIVIDAGHGGKHTGAKGASGMYEKEVNLAISQHLQRVLEQRGWRVVPTRTRDSELSPNLNADLDARVAVANGARAKLFVSVHANYASDRGVQGFEVYHHRSSAEGKRLARSIHGAFKRSIQDTDRGVKTAGFRVIKRARMPAVLVEVGFMSHRPTERKLATDAYRQRLAEAIADGIERYAGS
jgi:N-acetylmuramoyl-L-alanine amidase CwlD